MVTIISEKAQGENAFFSILFLLVLLSCFFCKIIFNQIWQFIFFIRVFIKIGLEKYIKIRISGYHPLCCRHPLCCWFFG